MEDAFEVVKVPDFCPSLVPVTSVPGGLKINLFAGDFEKTYCNRTSK